MTVEEKQRELIKLRDLNLATLDYHILIFSNHPDVGYDPKEHFENLKRGVHHYFGKGSLGILQKWFKDFTEIFQEGGELEFAKYIKDTTGYDINVLEKLYQRVDKILSNGKITSTKQFYDVMSLMNNLEASEHLDSAKLEKLNEILLQFELKTAKKR